MHSTIRPASHISRALLLYIGLLLLTVLHSSAQSTGIPDAANAGLPINGVFSGGSIDSVQLNNGNLHVDIPLLDLPSVGIPMRIHFLYDNKIWNYSYVTDPQYQYWVTQDNQDFFTISYPGAVKQSVSEETTNVDCGGGLSYPETKINSMTFVDEDGTPHQFLVGGGYMANSPPCDYNPAPLRLYAADSSGIMADRAPTGDWFTDVILKNGTKYTWPSSGVVNVEDANGNKIIASGSEATGVTISDTIGRTFHINYTTTLDTITYSDQNGTTKTISLSLVPTTINISSLCSSCYPQSWTAYLPNVLTLQNNISTYTFQFQNNGLGGLSSLTLPSGGTISWTYGSMDVSGDKVLTRTVTSNGQSATWQYQYVTGQQYEGGVSTITVTDPALNDTQYQCTIYRPRPLPLPNTLQLLPCYMTQEKVFNGPVSGGNVVVTKTTGYAVTGCVLPTSVRVAWTASGKVAETDTTWDSIPNSGFYDISGGSDDPTIDVSWGNPLSRIEYDYGNGAPGALLRNTQYTYLHQQNSTYASHNIADRLYQESIYNSATMNSATLVSQKTILYDQFNETGINGQGSLVSTSGTTNHDYTYFGSSATLRGLPTSVTRYVGLSSPSISTYTNYNDLGNETVSTDGGGHSTRYSYGAQNAFLTQVQAPDTGSVHHITATNYEINTGLKLSSTDENGQPTGYTYDSLLRPLCTNYPDGGQTCLNYNGDPVPPHITKTVLATPNPSIVTDEFYDGLGRISRTQLTSDPQGAYTTYTSYDAFGRVLTVSTPYRSTSDATYGVTCNGTWNGGSCASGYDSLGRLTVVTKQDGSTVQTDYSAFPAVTVTDETGRQRRSDTDALGRIVEVDEPGWFSGSPASGSINIGSVNGNGTDQSVQLQTSGPTQATGWVLISGAEKPAKRIPCTNQIKTQPTSSGSTTFSNKNVLIGALYPCYVTAYDSGSIGITVNGTFAGGVDWGKGSDAGTMSVNLVNSINGNSSSPVTASLNGGYVMLTSKAYGSGSNYSLSVSTIDDDPTDWPSPSFSASASGPALTGGGDASYTTVFDTGTVTVSVSTVSESVQYDQNSSSAWLASALAGKFNSDGNPLVSAASSGSTLTLTAKAIGAGISYSISGSSSTTQGQYFSSASFSAGSGNVSGGQNAGPGGLAYPFVTMYQYSAVDDLTCAVQKGTDSNAFSSCAAAPSMWRPRFFGYDGLSRLVSATNPETGTINYGYGADSTCNPDGENLRTQTDARGVTATFCYDALDRVTQKSFSDSTPALYFSYDVAPSWMSDLTNVKGRLVEAYNQYAGSSGSIAAAFVNSYDSMGRVTRQWQQTPATSPGGYFVYSAYDAAGQLKSLTYPSGRVISYTFNGAGRLYKAYSTSGGEYDYLNVSTFWPTGAWQNATFGNGTHQQDTYNNRLQPSELKLLTSGNAPIADRQYVWTGCAGGVSNGNNGNVCGINDLLNSARNQTYNFDALNRVISGTESDGAFNQTMSYDVWGNPSISGPSGANLRTYNTQNHDTAYGYDAAGNLTNDGTFTYSYDAEEQLSSFISNSTGSQVANYVYDADGNRVRKNVGSGWTEYIYFGSNIIAENTPSGWTDYIFAGGKRIAQISASGTQYYWGDHLGTTKMTLDASGNSQCYAIYTPFGSEVSGCPTHYKFNAKERDFEDGLDYFGARYYSSTMGRWMSPDWADKPTAVPYANFGNPQSLNLYSYVQNNPITLGDPDGHADGTVADVVELIESLPPGVRPVVVLPPVATGIVIGALVNKGITAYADHLQSKADAVFEQAASANKQKLAQQQQQNAQSNEQSESSPEPEASSGGNRRRGGGRNSRKSNENRRSQARADYEAAKAEFDSIDARPNKTKQDKIDREAARGRMNRARDRMRDSETHDRKQKGY